VYTTFSAQLHIWQKGNNREIDEGGQNITRGLKEEVYEFCYLENVLDSEAGGKSCKSKSSSGLENMERD